MNATTNIFDGGFPAAVKHYTTTNTPDLIIIDISLKNGNGIELVKQIRARNEKIKMLVDLGYVSEAERNLAGKSFGQLTLELAQGTDALNEAIDTIEETGSDDAAGQPLDADVMSRILDELDE